MKLAALKGGVRELQVKVPGEDGVPDEFVKVAYRPGELTLEVADQLQEVVLTGGMEADVAGIMLAKILVSWDLENDDGTPLGVDSASIKKVPVPFLGLVLGAIEEDSRPNASRDATSNGTSPQEAEQEASLTGTSSSESPTDTSASPGSFSP